MVRNSLENIIEIGSELVAVKKALPHGQFGKWLDVEFGWSERTVRNFMDVSQRFGKSANFADLPIQPSAAYLLAAPSVPDEAWRSAIEMAFEGEQITTKMARKIVAKARKRKTKTAKPVAPDKAR
jgi:hypothetical protein